MESETKPVRVRKPLTLRQKYERERKKLLNKAWDLNTKAYKLRMASKYQESLDVSMAEAKMRDSIVILNFRISCTYGGVEQKTDEEITALLAQHPELGTPR